MSSDTYTTTNTGKQAGDSAERLFKLFAGNEHRHVKNYGPPAWNEEKKKWELKVTTIHEPVTLRDWNTPSLSNEPIHSVDYSIIRRRHVLVCVYRLRYI